MEPNYRERYSMAHAAAGTVSVEASTIDNYGKVDAAHAGYDTRTGPSQQRSHTATPRSSRRSPSAREFKLQELTMLSISPLIRLVHRWWLQRAEHHYLICADVEQERAREAQLNVAYYQKRAALARSAQH